MLKLLALLFLMGASITAWSQTLVPKVKVNGQVVQSETQEPLAGVTVAIRPGRTAVITSAKGSFNLTAKPGDTLVFYSVGFKTTRYLVTKSPAQVVKVVMSQQNVELQGVDVLSRPSAEKINRALRNMKKAPEPSPTAAPPAPEPLFEEKETNPVTPTAFKNPASFLYEKYSQEGKERQKMEAINQQKRDSIARKKEAQYDELFLDRNKPFKEQYFYYRKR